MRIMLWRLIWIRLHVSHALPGNAWLLVVTRLFVEKWSVLNL